MIILLRNNKKKNKNILHKAIKLKNIVRHYPGNKGSIIKPIKDLSKTSSNALTPTDKKHPNYNNVIAYQKYKENRKKMLDNIIINVEKNTFDTHNEKITSIKNTFDTHNEKITSIKNKLLNKKILLFWKRQ